MAGMEALTFLAPLGERAGEVEGLADVFRRICLLLSLICSGTYILSLLGTSFLRHLSNTKPADTHSLARKHHRDAFRFIHCSRFHDGKHTFGGSIAEHWCYFSYTTGAAVFHVSTYGTDSSH